MLSDIKYMVIDIDGTMTDGGIYYDDTGNEIKKYNTKDAAAFFCFENVGIEPIVLTGRRCLATERRMKDLKVKFLYQDVKDKALFLDEFMNEREISISEIGYIGDELNDFNAMQKCVFKSCPKDACKEIKEVADYISPFTGGCGAVRDIAEFVLEQRGEWNKAISAVYGIVVGDSNT